MSKGHRGLSLLELTLVVAVALSLLAGGVFFMRQSSADAKIQQSKLRLEALRVAISASRYKCGRWPVLLTELEPNTDCNGQPIWTGTSIEPVTGSSGFTAVAGTAGFGWVYTVATGQIYPNIVLANHQELAGDPPATW